MRRLMAALAVVTLTSTSCGGIGQASTVRQASVRSEDPVATVAPTWIRGLRVVRDNGKEESCAWSTTYPQIPSAQPLTDALRRLVEERRAAFLQWARESGCGEQAGKAPELNMGFGFVAASGDVIGVRFTVYQLGGAGDGKSTTSLWYDGVKGQVVPALSLIDAASMNAFEELTGKALEGIDRQAWLADRSARTLDDLAFTKDGDLVVTFDEGEVAAGAVGQAQAVLPRAEVEPLLSDFGRRARAQVMRPADRMALPGYTADGSVDCRQVKCVALTFDDGPSPYTPRLLQYLARYRARATFFVVGQNVIARPGVVRGAVRAGHEVGNHSWSHRDLTGLSARGVRADLARTDQAIRKATGVTPTLVRPPYGAFDRVVRRQSPHPLVLWSVDTLDWLYRNSGHVTRAAVGPARPGSIILFHDIRPTTVAAIPHVLKRLAKRGFHFVTVSELYGGHPPALAIHGPSPRHP
ncbi:polysaccharide deacetylase family protein [Nonomuraea aurantiaca]|uniref:polysaccharide deacetylase family protein n=1 Tax=Nonomuraea aurantiaca TaxID=2878562 RepID=UPI001CDA3611|nr:polysaccharide deacetylase family protein [Nonomuraea aurantiaca]MCA2227704.1 polysaccharide deacetylase family protein [Nonomuraea aurantiaca]